MRAGTSISVRVVGLDGKRVSDATVIVTLEGPERDCWTTDMTDGQVVVEPLLIGRYTVLAWTDDGGFAMREHVDAGTTPATIELALARGAVAALTYKGRQSEAQVEVRVGATVLYSDDVVRDQQSEFVVPAGSIELRWSEASGSDTESQRLDLKSGETREVVWKGNR
jgi:hypothetical protein